VGRPFVSGHRALRAALALLVVPAAALPRSTSYAALPTSVREGNERLAPTLSVRQVGEAALDAGRLREAITELDRLHAAHPDAPEPACQLARAYLEAGLGAAARAVLRQAAATFPRSVRVQRTLGWALEHDLFGRLLLESAALRADDVAPTSADWYVIGRIAECYGVLGAARDAYAHVSKPPAPDHADVWNLVDRRLRVLDARP
jgi:hypothetical protein